MPPILLLHSMRRLGLMFLAPYMKRRRLTEREFNEYLNPLESGER